MGPRFDSPEYLAALSLTRRPGGIEAAEQLTPPWGQVYVRPAFAGDAEAAYDLAASLHGWQRAIIALIMFNSRVVPAATRELVRCALSQSHRYNDLRSIAGPRSDFNALCRYVTQPLPDNIPSDFTVYRGGNGVSERVLAAGTFWSLDVDTAALFAMEGRAAGEPTIVQAQVPRSAIVFLDTDREVNVILDRTPRRRALWGDEREIRAAYERELARIRANHLEAA